MMMIPVSTGSSSSMWNVDQPCTIEPSIASSREARRSEKKDKGATTSKRSFVVRLPFTNNTVPYK